MAKTNRHSYQVDFGTYVSFTITQLPTKKNVSRYRTLRKNVYQFELSNTYFIEIHNHQN
jgi:hypothetical protein